MELFLYGKKQTSYIEQILEATSHKAALVRLPTSYLYLKTEKTYRTLLEEYERTHKRRSSMDLFIVRASVGRQARIYLQQLWMDTGFSLENLLRAMDDRDE